MDFAVIFARLEARRFSCHYMNQFDTLDDMLEGRRYLVREADRVWVA